MKFLIYALGGGFGHITRAYKLSQLLNSLYNSANVIIIASYQNVPNFLHQNLQIQWVYPQNIQNLTFTLKSFINSFNPDFWITDVFANGIFYELPFILNDFSFFKVVIARILNYDSCRVFSEVHYDESWQIEWLPEYMNEYINSVASKNLYVKLPVLQNSQWIVKDKKCIIHAGSQEEINNLYSLHSDFEIINPFECYPLPIFEDCELVTAAGCNIFQDLHYIEKKHYIYPFNRKYDDQWIRAKNYTLVKNWFTSL